MLATPDFDVNAAGIAKLRMIRPANIDPAHKCPHRSRMSDLSASASPGRHAFSIRRHVVQQLLRLALDAEGRDICGLLGGRAHSVECMLLNDNDIAAAMRDWQREGLQALALFSTRAAPSDEIAASFAALSEDLRARIERLPVLRIRTDTKGRIETELHGGAQDGGSDIWPLEMQEDGGLYPSGKKG